MRYVKRWEDRARARMAKPEFFGAIAGALASTVAGKLFSDDDGGGYAGGQPAAASANAERLYGVQADAAARQQVISDEMYNEWKTNTLPLIRAQQQKAADPNFVEQAVSRAAGDQKTLGAVAKQQLGRNIELAGRGSDAIRTSELNKLDAANSGAVATAITNARTVATEQQRQQAIDAINLGQAPLGVAQTASNLAGNLTGSAAGGFNASAQVGLRAIQQQNDAQARSGYAWGNTVGPAISKGVTSWLSPSVAPPSTGGYDASLGYDPLGGYGDGYRHGGAIRYAEGGPISGPGTGTSDSIAAVKRPGTYILSADTVRAIGTKKVRDLMEKAGVRPGEGENSDTHGERVHLSTGEASLPPEVTRYYGEEFFHKLQQKYHKPVRDETGGLANGGAIRRRLMPRSVEAAIHQAIPAAR